MPGTLRAGGRPAQTRFEPRRLRTVVTQSDDVIVGISVALTPLYATETEPKSPSGGASARPQARFTSTEMARFEDAPAQAVSLSAELVAGELLDAELVDVDAPAAEVLVVALEGLEQRNLYAVAEQLARRAATPATRRQYAAIYRSFADWLRYELGRPPIVADLHADAISAYARHLEQAGGRGGPARSAGHAPRVPVRVAPSFARDPTISVCRHLPRGGLNLALPLSDAHVRDEPAAGTRRLPRLIRARGAWQTGDPTHLKIYALRETLECEDISTDLLATPTDRLREIAVASVLRKRCGGIDGRFRRGGAG